MVSEPQPILKLKKRKEPFQKITINRMPISIYNKLKQRASKLNKKVSVYCRVVLEHALEHRGDYTGPLKQSYPEDTCYPTAITIPILDSEFMGLLCICYYFDYCWNYNILFI